MLLGRKTTTNKQTLSTPLLSPFQPSVSFLPSNILSPKYPQGEASRLFNTLPSHEDCASNNNGLVTHIDWSMTPLTQLSSFLFTLTYPLFILFLSWSGSPPLTMADYKSGSGPLSCCELFSLLYLPSYPVLPHFSC